MSSFIIQHQIALIFFVVNCNRPFIADIIVVLIYFTMEKNGLSIQVSSIIDFLFLIVVGAITIMIYGNMYTPTHTTRKDNTRIFVLFSIDIR